MTQKGAVKTAPFSLVGMGQRALFALIVSRTPPAAWGKPRPKEKDAARRQRPIVRFVTQPRSGMLCCSGMFVPLAVHWDGTLHVLVKVTTWPAWKADR